VILNLTKVQLKACEDTNDITKTCRNLVKAIFPSDKKQAKTYVLSMSLTKKRAIHCKYRERVDNIIIITGYFK
jgi:hypothetical protein